MLKSEGITFISYWTFDISLVRIQGITFKMQFYNAEDQTLYFCCQNPRDNFHDAILPCRRYCNSYTVKPV